MKTEYEFINFVKVEDKPKTSVWICSNTRSAKPLGFVKWYAAWRRYCYFPSCPAAYSPGCLCDIREFLAQLNTGHHLSVKR